VHERTHDYRNCRTRCMAGAHDANDHPRQLVALYYRYFPSTFWSTMTVQQMFRRLGGILSPIVLLLLTKDTYAALDQPFTQSYSSLQHAACVSLFHRNGRVGCGTEDHSVQVGALYYFQGSLPDADDNSHYVAVVEDYNLLSTTLTALSQDDRLKGILVLNSTSIQSSGGNTIYSPESSTPQGYETPSAQVNYGYIQYKWNSPGEGLTMQDFHGIPMAFVTDGTVAQSLRVETQSSSNNNNHRVVAEFNYYMGPETVDSPSCLPH
jgi:Nicastrin small lobe